MVAVVGWPCAIATTPLSYLAHRNDRQRWSPLEDGVALLVANAAYRPAQIANLHATNQHLRICQWSAARHAHCCCTFFCFCRCTRWLAKQLSWLDDSHTSYTHLMPKSQCGGDARSQRRHSKPYGRNSARTAAPRLACESVAWTIAAQLPYPWGLACLSTL